MLEVISDKTQNYLPKALNLNLGRNSSDDGYQVGAEVEISPPRSDLLAKMDEFAKQHLPRMPQISAVNGGFDSANLQVIEEREE